MILLLSTEGDLSTDIIIDWLSFYNQSYLRIGPMDFIRGNIMVDIQKKTFQIYGKNFPFNEISVVWHRKFGFYHRSKHYNEILLKFGEEIAEQTLMEMNSIKDYFISMCKHAYFIGNPKTYRTNKLIELTMAQKSGFMIPQSLIISNYNAIKKQPNNFISKSLYNARTIERNGSLFTMYTSTIDSKLVSSNCSFFPSLVQEKIDKMIELRVFYILGEMYCMAILSQSNDQTKIDFRRYDLSTPNRYLPYSLDSSIKERIITFMNLMGLNTGSIDLILTTEKQIVFLEVNTEGQFGMIDFPCNYGIHRRIAQILIEKNNNYEIS